LLLNRLERDSPEYFACDICNVLHRYDGAERFGLSGLRHERNHRLPCVDKWFETSYFMITHASSTYIRNRLSFLQLKLAMRRFYYGPRAGISTDSLSYTQVRQISPDMTLLFSREAQIYPKLPGLHVRLQEILLVRARDELVPAIQNLNLLSKCSVACLHGSRVVIPIVKTLCKGKKAFLTRNCRSCNTDSKIEIVEIESKIALIVTRWINLGPGLTKEDPLWRAHALDSGPMVNLKERRHPATAWSPRACFEEVVSYSHKELQVRNLSYFQDQQYKNGKPFIAIGSNFWHIPYQEPIKGRRICSIWSQFQRHRVMARRKKAAAKKTRQKSLVHHSSSSEDRPRPRSRSNGDTLFWLMLILNNQVNLMATVALL
jgi:hypothetical protein